MTRPAILAVAADRDIDEARRWYEVHGGSRLAERFVDAVDSSLRRIERFPEGQPVVYRDRRRVLVGSFPYMILYGVEPDRLFVYRCIHLRRDPSIWRRGSG